jgi:hypothetical protein
VFSARQMRRLALAIVMGLAVLALGSAAGASAQMDGSLPPGAVEGAPPPQSTGVTGAATMMPNRSAVAPAGAPLAVQSAIAAANRIRKKTYIWGGGHRRWKAKGYDCSGAVSYVLHAAGLLSVPLVSGQLARIWGAPGPGAWITVYANRTHTYMIIAGLRFDTSPRGETLNQGRGPRWRQNVRTGAGFAVRHYPGL